jgi:hypothetical protein
MLCAAFVTWKMWRTPGGDPLLRVGATGVLTLLATPYGYSYDLVMLSAAVLIVIQRARWDRDYLLIPVWLWPVLNNLVNRRVGPLAPSILILAAGICIYVYFRSKRLNPVQTCQT